VDFSLPQGRRRARFDQLYSQLELYKALVRTYTKRLFSWRKALSRSHDVLERGFRSISIIDARVPFRIPHCARPGED